MDNVFVIAAYESGNYLSCTMRRIGNLPTHMHDQLEIGMVLDGTCRLTEEKNTWQLHENDIFSIEAQTPHSLFGNDCTLISVKFSQHFFERVLPEPKHPEFSCNSAVSGDDPAYETMRRLIAAMIWNNAYQQAGYELRNMSLVFNIMDVMYQNFRIENSEARNRRAHRYTARMMEISEIINNEYQNNLTLSELADRVHLSAPYLSKFFERQFGMTFLNYLAKVRLQHAVNELLQTDDTIETISANAGFPNSSAFVKSFKKEYGVLPSIYRRKERFVYEAPAQNLLVEQHDYLSKLKKYIDKPNSMSQQPGSSCYGSVSMNDSMGTLKHTWKNMLGISHASSLLLSDVQDMIRKIQEDIGFRWIKFNGIFSNDMHVYLLQSDGSPFYSFSYVDRALDFLLSVNLKPLIQLGFMPDALAKDKHQMFGNMISAPESNEKWCDLIEAFILHLQERYGIAEVRSWLFSVWDNPDLLYRFSDDETFYIFYRDTRRTVKACDKEIRFGAPATFYVTQDDRENWSSTFLNWCRNNNCLPDFLNHHFFDTVLADDEVGRKAFGFYRSMVLGEDPSGFSHFVKKVLTERHALGMDDLPVYLSEWNNTPSQQDLLNDTCFRSCYLIKNLLENYDCLDSFTVWALTDWMGEGLQPKELFFGGLGMLTSAGIPKACYNALSLLTHLGDTLIGKGDGWFITKKGDDLCMILYHYRHFSQLYARGELFDMTFSDRYTTFGPDQPMDAHIIIRNIPEGTYQVTESMVNRRFGSSFDQWVSMGAVELNNKKELDRLASLSAPGLNKYSVSTQNGVIRIDAMLDMLEVRLITISPM